LPILRKYYKSQLRPYLCRKCGEISSNRTCTGIWGFDCGAGPPEDGDNTFDACDTGAGNDESVEEIMSRDVVYVKYTDSWRDAVEVMFEKRVGGCPVIDNDDKVFGIVTERDIVRFLASQGRLDGYVRDYMTPNVITATPNTTVGEAMKLMISNRIRRLPIVKDGVLFGLIVSTDFLRYFGKDAFKMLETGNAKEALDKEIHEIVANSTVLKYKDPLVFESRDKISDVVKKMVEKGVGSALVVDGGRLEGIITERDLMKFLYHNL
jgi:CBS domain-containing protein